MSLEQAGCVFPVQIVEDIAEHKSPRLGALFHLLGQEIGEVARRGRGGRIRGRVVMVVWQDVLVEVDDGKEVKVAHWPQVAVVHGREHGLRPDVFLGFQKEVPLQKSH